jgi:hypothetical protein
VVLAEFKLTERILSRELETMVGSLAQADVLRVVTLGRQSGQLGETTGSGLMLRRAIAVVTCPRINNTASSFSVGCASMTAQKQVNRGFGQSIGSLSLPTLGG